MKSPENHARLKQLLTINPPDLLFLTETNMPSNSPFKYLSNWYQNLHRVDAGNGVGTGVSLITKHPNRIQNVTQDPEGRWLRVTINWEEEQLNILAIYAPASKPERKEWYERTIDPNEDLDIILGDFNIDLKNNKLNSKLKALLKNSALKLARPHTDHTWSNSRGHKAMLDGIFLRADLLQTIKSCTAVNRPKSDHKMVIVELDKANPRTHRTAPWKLNPNLAKIPEVKSQVNSLIESIDKSPLPILEKWTRIKHEARLTYIKCGNKLDPLLNSKTALKKAINRLNRMKEESPFSAATINLEERIDRALDEKADLEHLLNFERSNNGLKAASTFLTNKLKRRAPLTEVKVIRDPTSGKDCTSSKEILEAFHKFYSHLYGPTHTDENSHNDLLREWTPNKEAIKQANLGRAIKPEEVKEAIKSSNPRKSPGPDGLGIAFYQAHKEVVTPILTNLFNYFLEGNQIPSKFKSGVTITIFKKGDAKDIKNRRPITLLNCDYKLLSKIVANRLKRLLPKLIHNHQSGFIPGRSIVDNALTLSALLEKLRNHPVQLQEAAIMLLDIEKAFDTVSHSAILTTLRHLSLPTNIQNLLKNMILGSNIRVSVNGQLTPKIKIRRGTKQGDPISPILFVLTIEPLVRAIENSEAQGLTIPNSHYRVKALFFADDTATFTASGKDREIIKSLFSKASQAIGINVNKGKTVYYSLKQQNDLAEYEWVRPDEQSRYLGFQISLKEGIASRAKELTEELGVYCRRTIPISRTPKGRAIILNTYVCSRLHYQFYLEPLQSIKAIEPKLKRIYNWFIWSQGGGEIPSRFVPKMSFDRIAQPVEKGGLGIRHPYLQAVAQKAIYVKKLLKQRTNSPAYHVWKAYMNLRKSLPYLKPPSPHLRGGWRTYTFQPVEDLLLAYETAKDAAETGLRTEFTLTSTKLMYNRLSEKWKGTPHLVKFQSFLFKERTNLRPIWKSIGKIPLNKHRSLIWRYANGALPIPPKACIYCGALDSQTHALLHCPRAKWVLEIIRPLAEKIKEGGKIPREDPRGFLSSQIHKKIVTTSALWVVWHIRNNHNNGGIIYPRLVQRLFLRDVAKALNACPKQTRQKIIEKTPPSLILLTKDDLATVPRNAT